MPRSHATSPTAALHELTRAFAFGAADAAALRAVATRLGSRIRALAERFWAYLMAQETARALLGQARADHHQEAVAQWLDASLKGPHDERFYADSVHLGRVHALAGLSQPHLIAAMDQLREGALEACREVAVDGNEREAMQSALSKLFGLQLAMILEGYRAPLEHGGAGATHAGERASAGGFEAEEAAPSALATPDPAHARACDELRNPLNAASLQLRVLAARLGRSVRDPAILESLDHARADVDRLARAVDEALTPAPNDHRGGLRPDDGSEEE